MKIKIEIKHYFTGAVLFEFEKENNTQRDTILEAIKQHANLSSADLRSADLSFANLRFAKNLDSDATDYYWHIHHEVLYEWLTEPLRARINYIKTEKAKYETSEQIELRLRPLKPVLGKIPTTEKGWERLHKKECPKCPWDGKSIFPEQQR